MPGESATVITLLRDFTFVAAAGQGMNTEWCPFNTLFRRADLRMLCKLLTPIGGGSAIQVNLETSDDTSDPVVLTTNNLIALGTTVANISDNIAQFVRLNVNNPGGTPVFGVISVWLLPKSD
jgi:hypothetical protein